MTSVHNKSIHFYLFILYIGSFILYVMLLIQEFLMNLNQEVASLLQYDGTNLVRDEFNTHKLIVTATANGKVCVLNCILCRY